MALRLPKAQLPAELSESMIAAFGAVFEPTEVIWHNPGVATANTEFAGRIAAWDALDDSLKSYAHMAVAALVGCSWCLDINYFQAQHKGLDLAKASQVPNWRASELFTPLERDVMAYAEAVSVTPPTVTDEQYGDLLDVLGAAAMVELTAYVAFVNMAARNNIANGVSSQGFSESCEIPLAARPATGVRPA
ncbi:hypothetical protein ATKI12_5347 [Kitasatospora sp. Ki12]|uniref:carboxymuconolactone decarboxylase family protein n=1 Tax=Kitasatospora xanthocidica TaxID=83382 RepID=UPI00167BFE9B|nr:carboxymuconolactone decarboxylase family protein [Kitasatospora xanthocidica]GHF70448.1 hypothetical protein GCM10018790_55500 [Kitasatospora xanthocidica]